MSADLLIFVGAALGCLAALSRKARPVLSFAGAFVVVASAWTQPATVTQATHSAVLAGLVLALGLADTARFGLAAIASVLTGLILVGDPEQAAQTLPGLAPPIIFASTMVGAFGLSLWTDAMADESQPSDMQLGSIIAAAAIVLAVTMSADASGLALRLPILDESGRSVAAVAAVWTSESAIVGARDAGVLVQVGWAPVVLLIVPLFVVALVRTDVLSAEWARRLSIAASLALLPIAAFVASRIDPSALSGAVDMATPRLADPAARYGAWPPEPWSIDRTPVFSLGAALAVLITPWLIGAQPKRERSSGQSPGEINPQLVLVISIVALLGAALAVEFVRWNVADVGGWQLKGSGLWLPIASAAFGTTSLAWGSDARIRTALATIPVVFLAVMIARPELWS